jgi:hypothetical protein
LGENFLKPKHQSAAGEINIHLVVENLGLASGGVGDEASIQDIEDILADLLELELDLAAVLLDGGDVLVRALGLLLLLDGGDDAPRGTAGADNVLVGDAEEVALVDGELTAQLSDLLHVGNHLIVTLGLLAEAGQEGLAIILRISVRLLRSSRIGEGVVFGLLVVRS